MLLQLWDSLPLVVGRHLVVGRGASWPRFRVRTADPSYRVDSLVRRQKADDYAGKEGMVERQVCSAKGFGMNLKELKAIVAKGESERTEFKRSTGQRTEASKTVCALANGLGGCRLFGITDKGEIVGQQVATSTLEDVANECAESSHRFSRDVETVTLKGGNSVIALRGCPAAVVRSLMMVGPTCGMVRRTRVMPRAVYEQRVIEKFHATSRWENQPVSSGVTFADLDEEEIQLTVDNAVDLGRLEPLRRRSTKAILIGLGLIVEGKLLNAAVALYGKSQRLQSLYPQRRSSVWPGSAERTGLVTLSITDSIGATLLPYSVGQRHSGLTMFPLQAAWYRAA